MIKKTKNSEEIVLLDSHKPCALNSSLTWIKVKKYWAMARPVRKWSSLQNTMHINENCASLKQRHVVYAEARSLRVEL